MENYLKDLTQTTFIIPIRIESDDRLKNLEVCLKYLNTHFDTNIIVYESDVNSKSKKICKEYKNVKYIFSKDNATHFHRTLFLNEMLKLVKTPVVVNYDADIILPIDAYVTSTNFILDNIFDLVYPYFKGFSQKKVDNKGRDILFESLDLNKISMQNIEESNSLCGHCQFFNTRVYREGGMENENFISWGPEDVERMERFQKLGYRVHWSDYYIYHLEHTRYNNSNSGNEFFNYNNKLFEYLKNLSTEELKKYNSDKKYLYDNIIILEELEKELEKNTPERKAQKYHTFNIPQQNVCRYCGHPKDRVKYNFCQKCNRLY